jgi:hypothetical protein
MSNLQEAIILAFIRRAARNRLSLRVKMADVEDNLDPAPLCSPTPEDRGRMARYHRALSYLRGVEARGRTQGSDPE